MGLTAPPAPRGPRRAAAGRPGPVRYRVRVTVWETVLVFVVLPLGFYGLLALLVFGPGLTRSARYRPGRPWEHEPVWYVPRPDATGPDATGPAAGEAGRAALAAPAADRALPAGERAGRTPAVPAAVLDAPVRTARGGASGDW